MKKTPAPKVAKKTSRSVVQQRKAPSKPAVQKPSYPGQTYQLQAVLNIDDKEIKRSEVVTVVAPAYSVELPLKVTWKDLPEDVVSVSTTKLAETVTVNGFVPMNSVLEVYALNQNFYKENIHQITDEVLSESALLTSISNPIPSTHWLWDQATPLQTYMVVVCKK
jgi:hypothetical protein